MKGWLSATLAATVVTAAATSALAQAPAPAAPTAPASATFKIAYVDVQRVLARSAAGVAAREQLEREKATMQKEMDGRRQDLEKLREELEKKGPLMTADARRDKQDQFERKRRDAARLADDFQKELEKKESVLLQKVLQEISGVIDRIGKDRGCYLVVEKRGAGVIYASAEADITDDVIRAYDQQAPKSPAPAAPAAPAAAPPAKKP
jgi:outer membrane protein